MEDRKIVLAPEDARELDGIDVDQEVVFQITGVLLSRRKDGAVVIEVKSTEINPVQHFKEAARRAKIIYVRPTIEPSVG